MTSTRRDAIKTTGAFATLVSLGIITQAQANAAVTHDSFAVKSVEDALKAIGGTAAIANAVHNALGVRVPMVPATADRVLNALGNKRYA